MRNLLILATSLATLSPWRTNAQSTVYTESSHVKLMSAPSKEMANPWDGGTNCPQFTLGDLNNDGKKDLVIFEAARGTIKTYIASGTGTSLKYTYTPQFQKNFPKYVMSYAKLLDYNCDNIPDLFERGSAGFTIHKGYYNAANQLCFTYYKAVFYNNINAYVDNGDIPEIVDIDGDGDLDLFAFNILGGHINFYKNLRAEQGKSCDSFIVKHQDQCWGKVLQGYTPTQVLGNSCAPVPLVAHTNTNTWEALNSASKTTHTGNTLCFTDFNNNGIYDYFNGGVSYRNIQFLTNGKATVTGVDSMIAQDTAWSGGGHTFSVDLFPAAFWLDIDQDGDKDLIMAPHGDGQSENIKGVNFYKNIGSITSPVWQYVSDSFFVQDHLDVGSTSTPVYYDYNKDGKPDLFVLAYEKYIGNGQNASSIAYYENTSTTGNPSYQLKTTNFLNLESQNFKALGMAIGDLDNDGKDDLVFGKQDGKLVFYKNNAPSVNVSPQWSLQYPVMKTLANTDVDVASLARPYIADVDGDGKKDLLIARWDGYVALYSNTGNTSGLLTFTTNTLGQMHTTKNGVTIGNISVYYGSMDNSGKKYFLIGSGTGVIGRFENPVGNTDPNATYTVLDTFYSQIQIAGTPTLDIMDVDNDGKREMLCGSYYGGVQLFQQGVSNGITSIKHPKDALSIFPNPAQHEVTIVIPLQAQDGRLECFDATGRLVGVQQVAPHTPSIRWQVAGYVPGVYTFKFINTKEALATQMIVVP